MSKDCKERKNNNNKKNEKAENAVDREEDNLVFYYLKMVIEKENIKRKFSLWRMLKCLRRQVHYVPLMVTHFLLMKNTWIVYPSVALCHIMNVETSLFDLIVINKLIQGSS